MGNAPLTHPPLQRKGFLKVPSTRDPEGCSSSGIQSSRALDQAALRSSASISGRDSDFKATLDLGSHWGLVWYANPQAPIVPFHHMTLDPFFRKAPQTCVKQSGLRVESWRRSFLPNQELLKMSTICRDITRPRRIRRSSPLLVNKLHQLVAE